MVLLKRPVPRRTLLRGLLQGAAVSIALPFLDSFLDDSGKALASGAPLPVRFGTWFWGCGHTPDQAIVERATTGPGIRFLEECAPLQPFADKINVFTGFNTPLDGQSNYVHHSGWVASRTGMAPTITGEIPGPTFDLLIADAMGGGTRFRSIDLVSNGTPRNFYSARNTFTRTAAEASPVALYARLFGSGFVDPNKSEFKPDPAVMLHRSVLSAVMDESKALQTRVSASDRARLDEYFTSIRQVENQLDLQMQKPAPNAACVLPSAQGLEGPEEDRSSFMEVGTVERTHAVMTRLLVMALACNQTRIFNMVFSDAQSGLHKVGDSNTHHTLTHEEEVDPKVGYQRNAYWFNCFNMRGAAAFIDAFAKCREGDGSLLDNTLVFATSETSYARLHKVDNLPMMTIGAGGGRVKTGLHVVGNGDPVTRVGFTAMRAMGVPINRWGTRALETSRPITDVLA
jgi:hypothetical protein